MSGVCYQCDERIINCVCDEPSVTPWQEVVRLRAEVERLRSALLNLLRRDEQNTCTHEKTHRGGALWEICDDCGAAWADDVGGKPKWNDPPEWVEARAALNI